MLVQNQLRSRSPILCLSLMYIFLSLMAQGIVSPTDFFFEVLDDLSQNFGFGSESMWFIMWFCKKFGLRLGSEIEIGVWEWDCGLRLRLWSENEIVVWDWDCFFLDWDCGLRLRLCSAGRPTGSSTPPGGRLCGAGGSWGSEPRQAEPRVTDRLLHSRMQSKESTSLMYPDHV